MSAGAHLTNTDHTGDDGENRDYIHEEQESKLEHLSPEDGDGSLEQQASLQEEAAVNKDDRHHWKNHDETGGEKDKEFPEATRVDTEGKEDSGDEDLSEQDYPHRPKMSDEKIELEPSASRGMMIPKSKSSNEIFYEWPQTINAPHVLDVLGSSVSLRCPRIPNARYTFQVARGRVFKSHWQNTPGGTQEGESVAIHGLHFKTKYHFRARITDADGVNPTLVSPPSSAVTLSSEEESQILRRRFREALEHFDQQMRELAEENEFVSREKRSFEKALADSEDRNEQLSNDVRTLKDQVSTMEEQMTRLQSENPELKRKEKEFEQVLSRLREQSKATQASLKQKELEVDEKDKVIKSLLNLCILSTPNSDTASSERLRSIARVHLNNEGSFESDDEINSTEGLVSNTRVGQTLFSSYDLHGSFEDKDDSSIDGG